MKLLIVENEPILLSALQKGFVKNNNDVSIAIDGNTALEMIHNYKYDVVILDIIPQETNGFEICRKLRASKIFVPILVLTSLISSENVITALNAGADDYIAKPFNFDELDARVNALNRRSTHENNIITINDLEINGNTKTVIRARRLITLTPKEFRLLYFLARNKETIVTRWQLLDNVWDNDSYMNINIVEVYISFLRKKIDVPFKNNLIHTIKGLGYTIKSF
ncbi:response regulator transcription factor [Flavobacterium sp. LS1R49]|uniref:Response regulator transcription factor n=1 Tax=Flavobacterium shii TaxID=2987687 RepID=A0A9X2ZFJ1_9FLAO|nr:response regulator transcription factor [Flavobacterium shii]MCV9930204.1 response regulator transcription factor [Flavobacterium shii]